MRTVTYHPMKSTTKSLLASAIISSALVFLSSCEDKPVEQPKLPAVESSVSTTGTMNYEGEIISIPSPIQIASLIQKNNIPFNAALINSVQNKEKYLNQTKKALNIGVYGADLAYIANYNLGQLNSDYFDVIAKLSQDLEIIDHLDQSIMQRLMKNIQDKDSLLKLNADFFRAGDKYLKSSDRSQLSGYILLGGWIESLHLAADAAKVNDELMKRLSEQKYSAMSMSKLIMKFDDPQMANFKPAIEELCETLSALESTYTYKQPITDAKEKTTYFTSLTSVKISEEQLEEITEQISAIRNLIIE
jgi:hypothetical protein